MKTLTAKIEIPEYYKQWQLMPGSPYAWQNSPEQQLHPGRKQVADLVKANSKSVLDVACGIGLDYKFYKDTPIEYLGVDITPKFVDVAKEKGVPARVANVLDLPFDDASWDSVVCKDLLIHLPPGDMERAFREMVRVARVQVVTLEDEWQDKTKVMLCENYASYDPNKQQLRELRFFNNVYGSREMLTLAAKLGLTVQVYRDISHKTVVDGRNTFRVYSQITVYSKGEKTS